MHAHTDVLGTLLRTKIPELSVDSESTPKRDIIKSIMLARDDGRVPVIAEIKHSAFGKRLTEKSLVEAAFEMIRGGTAALSVLTDGYFFNGSIDDVKTIRNCVNIPVLRKDFIRRPEQLKQVRSDAALLIVRLITRLNCNINDYMETALSLDMEPLVEVGSVADVAAILDLDPNFIAINNRDLETLNVDLSTTELLAPILKRLFSKATLISASGIHVPYDVERALLAGCDGILVGTSIMQSPDIEEKVKQLVYYRRSTHDEG
jgi:indole-3-glycerol phosphate synthase